ncbi:MAG: glycosyltransferase family 4 protein, partial [Saprospiraceae bacterium]|nr:glycosyltransferase family 4 protein [Saprospiraceae bacterium]
RRYIFFRFFVRFFEKKSAQAVDLVVVCSKDLKKRVEKGYNIESHKVYAMFHGFEIMNSTFQPRAQPFEKPVRLLFIKSNLRRGAMDIFSKALAQLMDYQFILTVIGPHISLKSEIEKMLSDAPNVKLNFIGFADTKAVYQEMSSHHILCTPSRDEALGIANAEGLASGIAVVSTRIGGIPEVLDNGKNGWLAEPEDVEDLARTLRECIEASPSVRMEKSLAGRRFVEKHFDFKKINAALLEKCEELLKNDSGAMKQ